MALLLKNATFIDWETLAFTQGNLLIHEGTNAGFTLLQTTEPLPENIHTILDCKGKYVTKSFAIGHHHIYSALARGMPAPPKSPNNFHEILQYIWWRLDKCLDKEMIELSAMVTAIAAAKAGASFIIDHHASPNAIGGSLETIANAIEKIGLNHLLCYEITDRDGKEKADLGLQETADYLSKRQGLVGLHASFTLGNETLEQAAKLMHTYNTGAHVHLAEDLYDQQHCMQTYGTTVTERFESLGMLNHSSTILVHGLHLSDHERRLIAGSSAWIAQNPESNLNNKVGFFNSNLLGNKLMLGTDGMHSDMLQSAKAAFFNGAQHDTIGYDTLYQRFRNVHRYLAENKFDGDCDNNLVVLDYDSPTAFNTHNFVGHFLFGLRSNHVLHLISNGKAVMIDRKIMLADEDLLLEEARKLSLRLWEKMQAL